MSISSISLTIVIVNYRSWIDVCNCIASAGKYNFGGELEWIIVDNDSQDDSRQKIMSRFPFVKWIEMNYNAGFAKANNEAIRQSKSEVVLLLNPDVLFFDDSLAKCFDRFVKSKYVACCVQLLNADKTPQISGGYFIKGGLNNLLPLPVLGKLFKGLGNLFRVKKTSVKNTEGIKEVDWINGAFMMIKKPALDKSGLFDEDFFLYAEEIEWCSRLKKAGEICIYGDLHAIHMQGATANLTFDSTGKGYHDLFDKKGRQILVSNFLRIRKQFGVGWFLFHLLCYVLEIPLFFLLAIVSAVLLQKKYSLKKFVGYLSNLGYLLVKSGKMIFNKPYFYKVS